MTEIVLARHASTAWSGQRYCGRADPWLDAAGRAAAARLGAELASTLPRPVAVVSSSRRRARQTARAIAMAAGGAAISVDPRWDEVDVGWADGLTFAQVERRFPALAGSLVTGVAEVDWPGGETATALEDRIRTAWAEVLALADSRHAPGSLVVVSHAGALRIAAAMASGRPVTVVPFMATATATRVERTTVLRSDP